MDGVGQLQAGLRIAVTGASGFLGARLLSWLAANEAAPEVIVLSRRPTGTAHARTVDFASYQAVREALDGCRSVVHCAFDFLDLASNIQICEALARAAASQGVRLVHISTAAVHEPFPDGDLDETGAARPGGSDYKAVKLAIEAMLSGLVETIGLDLVILQPTVVYGPQGGAWTDSPIRELLTGTVVLPNSGSGLCNAVYVDDVCQAVARAITADLPSGERILISGAKPVAWRDFYGAYCDMLALDALRLDPAGEAKIAAPHPPNPANSGASPARRLKHAITRTLGAKGASRLHLGLSMARCVLLGATTHVASGPKLELFQSRCHVRIDKACRLLGYAPQFTLDQGMAQTKAYVLQRYGTLSRLRR